MAGLRSWTTGRVKARVGASVKARVEARVKARRTVTDLSIHPPPNGHAPRNPGQDLPYLLRRCTAFVHYRRDEIPGHSVPRRSVGSSCVCRRERAVHGIGDLLVSLAARAKKKLTIGLSRNPLVVSCAVFLFGLEWGVAD